MNEAVQSEGRRAAAGNGEMSRREQLSALADGELDPKELAQALDYAQHPEGHAAWQLYHLVGDVMRSAELAKPPAQNFMDRLREELAKEGQYPRPEPVPVPVAAIAPAMEDAANASVFRWKMVAGFASLAAVAAIGWTSLGVVQGVGSPSGGQMASVSESAANGGASAGGSPVVAVADADGGAQVMLRDPRLDELLAAHKQFGSTTALQMPAGFLRNATFETPSR